MSVCVQKLLEQCHKRLQITKSWVSRPPKKAKKLTAYNAAIMIAGLDDIGRGPFRLNQQVAEVTRLETAGEFAGRGHVDLSNFSHTKRSELRLKIREVALILKIVAIPPAIIDRENIYQATRQGMKAGRCLYV